MADIAVLFLIGAVSAIREWARGPDSAYLGPGIFSEYAKVFLAYHIVLALASLFLPDSGFAQSFYYHVYWMASMPVLAGYCAALIQPRPRETKSSEGSKY